LREGGKKKKADTSSTEKVEKETKRKKQQRIEYENIERRDRVSLLSSGRRKLPEEERGRGEGEKTCGIDIP